MNLSRREPHRMAVGKKRGEKEERRKISDRERLTLSVSLNIGRIVLQKEGLE